MAKSQIFVPQTNTIYPSSAAAAAALGVDASNIGKVLRGARKSAGGYNFVRVDPSISPQTLQDITEAIGESLSDRQKRRQAQSREKYKERLAPEEAAAYKAREQAKRKAARELQKQLREVNKIQREYKKQKLEGISGIIPELEKLKDIIGRNKSGGFKADQSNLLQFDLNQIQALTEAVKKQASRKGFKDLEQAKKKKQAIAFQMGVSVQELDNYADVLPELWNLLALARKVQEKGYDQTLYNTVQEAMQNEADPEDLRRILHDLYQNQMAALEDEIEEDLTDKMNQAAEELQGLYEKPEDAAAEQINAEDAAEDMDIFDGDWITLHT